MFQSWEMTGGAGLALFIHRHNSKPESYKGSIPRSKSSVLAATTEPNACSRKAKGCSINGSVQRPSTNLVHSFVVVLHADAGCCALRPLPQAGLGGQIVETFVREVSQTEGSQKSIPSDRLKRKSSFFGTTPLESVWGFSVRSHTNEMSKSRRRVSSISKVLTL